MLFPIIPWKENSGREHQFKMSQLVYYKIRVAMEYLVLHAESFIMVPPFLADYTYALSPRSPTEILLLIML